MFTGLIESVGHVSGLIPTSSGHELRVRTSCAHELALGESVAVNGVCLTVTAIEANEMRADIGPETARVTTLGSLHRDRPVNLERSMRADSRVGGHFVQGHVDGTGTIERMREEGDAHWIAISFPANLAPLLVHRGSIAVDGISLTVAKIESARLGAMIDRFEVMIVPYTWAHTNLSSLAAGDRVNLECDMLGKYVARAVEVALQGKV